MGGEAPILDLLEQYHTGAPRALELLIERLRPWLWSYVRSKMGPALRVGETSEDVVHEVLLKIFQKGPGFLPRTDDQLKRLVAAIALNRLRDRHDWISVRREVNHAVSHIGDDSTPSQRARHLEEAGLLEVALQVLDPEDALIIHERNWENLDFREISRRRDIAEDAARMRFNRAVRRLGRLVRQLESGDLDDIAPDAASVPVP